MKTLFVIDAVIILLFASCKKENTTAGSDFRDKLTGIYVTSSYSWASYPTPPTYYSNTVYNQDTVLIQVVKLSADSTSILVQGDTLRLLYNNDSTLAFMSGCCHYEKQAYFWKDSLRYTKNTGGSPSSSFGNGWKGKKQ